MEPTRTDLNIDKAIGFPAMQLSGAPRGAARPFAAETALRYGVHAYVTSVYHQLNSPPA